MSSQNAGEQEGKPDYGLIFDDFPHCWSDFPHELALIKNDYKALLNIALSKITLEDLQKAREYGCRKYDRFNFIQSRGTADHYRFMSANRRSIYRHLVALRREDIDEESGCMHWAMVALRCMIAIEYSYAEVNEKLDALLASEPKKTIYDWSIVPPRYKFMAKDKDGKVFMYPIKPSKENSGWAFSHNTMACCGSSQTTDIPWEDSLEDRPTADPKKTIYDWSDAPKDAVCAFTDESGTNTYFSTFMQTEGYYFRNLEARPMTLDRIGELNDAL